MLIAGCQQVSKFFPTGRAATAVCYRIQAGFPYIPANQPLKTDTSLKRLFETREIAKDGAIFAL